MYLVDTNIWLERLLEQAKSEEVGQFLDQTPTNQSFITKPDDTESLVNAIDRYHLDFDDAYQHVAAEKNRLVVVSFDGDLDKTPNGRKTPAEITAASVISD